MDERGIGTDRLALQRRQQERHGYRHVPMCGGCSLREICDGFHPQYVERWGGDEARPYPGPPIHDPTHFIQQQNKLHYPCTPGPQTSSDAAVGPKPPQPQSLAGIHLTVRPLMIHLNPSQITDHNPRAAS
ncbi:hypothetical protein GCM10022224_035590 [Nonomuraea antimicrobica]|uniref:Uncharacterized protein n=1 Tax=Nonomuraea antimicrobica TaxID=561173 RepID=A0ABP7BUU9_9ACTN